jgi:hypothetical protein
MLFQAFIVVIRFSDKMRAKYNPFPKTSKFFNLNHTNELVDVGTLRAKMAEIQAFSRKMTRHRVGSRPPGSTGTGHRQITPLGLDAKG